MERVVAGAIAGAIAGVIYFALEMAAARWMPRWRKAARAVSLVVSACVWIGLRSTSVDQKPVQLVTTPFQTPQQRMFRDVTDELLAIPGFERAFDGLTAEEAKAKGRALSMSGMRRLDDPSLLVRAQVLNMLLARLSKSACAAIAGASQSPENLAEIEGAVSSLDRETYAKWLELSKRAMIAELQEVPVRSVVESEVEESFQGLVSMLSAEDSARLARGLSKGASEEDACWAVRTLYRLALDLPEPDRAVLLRALVSE